MRPFSARTVSRRLTRAGLSWLLAGGLALSIGGCAPPKVSLSQGYRVYEADDYKAVLKIWTRQARLNTLEEMDNVLTVTSTYESWDFRHAYAARYARDFRLSETEKEQFLKRSLEQAGKFHEFYVAFFAQDEDWNELDGDDRVWITRLVDSTGNETEPANLQKIENPGALEVTYYPYTSEWRTVYRLSFPTHSATGKPTISPQAKSFGLLFNSVQGQRSVIWEVQAED